MTKEPTTPRFTYVAFAEYSPIGRDSPRTRGTFGRKEIVSLDIGYCRETPEECLQQAIPHYIVTHFDGDDLFDHADKPTQRDPRKGLKILETNPTPPYGMQNEITGNIAELLNQRLARELKRQSPLQKDEIQYIIECLKQQLARHKKDLQIYEFSDLGVTTHMIQTIKLFKSIEAGL